MGELVSLLLAILICVVVSISTAKVLGFGTILGFLVSGMIVGPFGLGLVTDQHTIEVLGEFGIIFLLFLIGVEMKPSKLWNYRKWVFGLGGLQVLTMSIIFGTCAVLIGFSMEAAIILAMALSLSSTAIDLQILNESKDIEKFYGQKAFSILLFQDIMAIPILALIPVLALGANTDVKPDSSLLATILPIFLVFIVVIFGKYFIGKILQLVARTKSKEGFTAVCLTLVLLLAWLTDLVGLPMAMGGFIAGIMISESNFRHQVQTNVEPFKLLLLGFFFIGIGMGVDFAIVNSNLSSLLKILFFIIVVKFLVLYLVCRCFNIGTKNSFHIASILSQVGEFALVVLHIVGQPDVAILNVHDAHFMILIVSISMFLTPISFKVLSWISEDIFVVSDENADALDSVQKGAEVVILGYGRVGMTVAKMLEELNISYVALDSDAKVVGEAKKLDKPVYFGDTSSPEILESLGLSDSTIVIVALSGTHTIKKSVEIIREHFPKVKIFARAKNHIDSHLLKQSGAMVAIPETTESSLQMGVEILSLMGIEKDTIHELTSSLKINNYEKLHNVLDIHSKNNKKG